MTIQNQNIEVFRGDSEIIAVTLLDANGDPFVLSGSGMIRYRVAQTADDDPAADVIVKNLNDGILLDGSVAEISLLPDDTDLPTGIYYHELKVEDGGDVATAMVGTFIIKRSLRMADEQQMGTLRVIVNAEVI